MDPYADIAEFFVEAIFDDFEKKWIKERQKQIIDEDEKALSIKILPKNDNN